MSSIESEESNSTNPINKLPLETQIFYIQTLNYIKNMSYEQLLDYSQVLFKYYLLQQNALKDIMRSQLLSEDFYNSKLD